MFLALIFITAIATLNIFFSITMLIIEKKDDIKTFKSMGAKNSTIGNIFFIEGMVISAIGVTSGLLLGYLLAFLQLKYGLLKMGMVSALVDSYPIRIEPTDFIYTALAIFVVSYFITKYPSKKAANI